MHFRQSNLRYVIENLAFMAARDFDAKYKGQWLRTRRVHRAGAECKLKIPCASAAAHSLRSPVCARDSQCLHLLRYDGVFSIRRSLKPYFFHLLRYSESCNNNNGHCEPPFITLPLRRYTKCSFFFFHYDEAATILPVQLQSSRR